MFHSWTPVFSGVRFRLLACGCRFGSGLGRFCCLRPSHLVRFHFGGVQLLKKKVHRTPKPAVICYHFMTGTFLFDVLGLWLVASEASRVGGPLDCVRRDGSDGWRSPVPWARSCTSSANHRCKARRLVQSILTHLDVDGVRDGRLFTSRQVLLLGFVLGLRFVVPEALRRHSGQLLRQRQAQQVRRCGVRRCVQLRRRREVLQCLFADKTCATVVPHVIVCVVEV